MGKIIQSPSLRTKSQTRAFFAKRTKVFLKFLKTFSSEKGFKPPEALERSVNTEGEAVKSKKDDFTDLSLPKNSASVQQPLLIFRVRHPKNRKQDERPKLDGKPLSLIAILRSEERVSQNRRARIYESKPRGKIGRLTAFLENEVLQKRAIFRVRCPKNRRRLPQSRHKSGCSHAKQARPLLNLRA